jgi:hypothetical protein
MKLEGDGKLHVLVTTAKPLSLFRLIRWSYVLSHYSAPNSLSM